MTTLYTTPDLLVTTIIQQSKSPDKVIDNNIVMTYVDNGYDLNDNCRNGSPCVDSIQLQKQFKEYTFDKAFCLYRGISNLKEQSFFKDELVDPGFCSTSIYFSVAESFVRSDSKDETCCILHIHCHANKPIKLLPVFTCLTKAFAYEKEILLPPNTILQNITDNNLITQIAHEMNYSRDTTGFSKDGICIILKEISSQPGGGHLIHILGRNRKILTKRNTQYVRYMNEIITLLKAKKMDAKR